MKNEYSTFFDLNEHLDPDLDQLPRIIDFAIDKNNPSRMFLTGSKMEYPFYLSINGGKKWIGVSDTLVNTAFLSFDRNYKNLYMYGQDGLFIMDIETIIKTGLITEETQKPNNYMLSQNYPNPFNGETVIHFEIERPEFVTLDIYNQLGQKVATLVNEMTFPGGHSVRFKSDNLASGIYFYQLKTEKLSFCKSMILIK